MAVLRDILVPETLVRDARRFGGQNHAGCLRGDLQIEGMRVTALRPGAPTPHPRLVIPALTEAHCHLDKCHSITRMQGVGGDLKQALARQFEDKANWTRDDVITRASRGLSEAQAAGCSTLRTHIDWGDTTAPPLAWSIVNELAIDAQMDLQCAALTDIGRIAEKAYCDAVARHISRADGAFGIFLHGHANIRPALENMFGAATRFGLGLDFHVDEGLHDLNGLETVADVAIETGFEGPLLCGHAVSLANRSGDDLERILEKLRLARITVCALPTTNLYLQGRTNGTPDRRGLTRLRELRAAGVPVIAGSDNVADAFCPMGQHDPMAALHLAAFAAHLDPPMEDWLPMITTDAMRAIGRAAVYVDDARVRDLRISDAQTVPDLVAGRFPLKQLQTSGADGSYI